MEINRIHRKVTHITHACETITIQIYFLKYGQWMRGGGSLATLLPGENAPENVSIWYGTITDKTC